MFSQIYTILPHLTSWSRAALLTQYPSTPGKARVPVTLETWMMFPLLEVRWGAASWVRRKGDLVLMFMILS